jgi:dihydroorotate dehydrogenase
MTQAGWAPVHHPSAVEQRVEVKQQVMGLTFSNPVGLAAGFDKDGQAIQPLLDLGLGLLEIGSVTLQPQPGNPSPRMFRLAQDQGVINRYGLNSQGMDVVQQNLKEFRTQQQQQQQPREATTLWEWMAFQWSSIHSRPPAKGIVGVNLGQNQHATHPLQDYATMIEALGPYADYVVLNISCPNQAGGTELQQNSSQDQLRQLLQTGIQARNRLKTRIPLLVKLSPDLDERTQEILAQLLLSPAFINQVDGMILTNTSTSRPSWLLSSSSLTDEKGGLSGQPLKDLSTATIRNMYALTKGQIPIIGVGGIASGHDAYEKLKAGASLVQVYTGMVYQGPGMISMIRHELAQYMLDNGQRHIQEVIGVDHADLFWKRRQQGWASQLLSSVVRACFNTNKKKRKNEWQATKKKRKKATKKKRKKPPLWKI